MGRSKQLKNVIKLSATILFLALIILCQGCVVFSYPIPEVKGSVVDASTKKPITNARIEVRKHPRIFCNTSADGSFDLPANHVWKFCFLLPGDYLVIAPLSFTATNYQVFTNSYLGSHDGKPVVLDHPIELQKELHP